MDILERIKERGYEVIKAGDYNEDNPYAFNYAHLAIRTPSGNVKPIVGTLDRPLYIKDKTLQTSRRELIEAIYHPDKNGWCLLENGFDLKSKSVFEKIETQLGLKSYKTEEEGASVENESTAKFPTHFVNGEAYLTVLNGEYIVQLFHQADIDCFITDTFVFNHKPMLEEFHAAYDLMQFKVHIMCKRIKEINDGVYWFEQLVRYKDLLGNAYPMLTVVIKN